MDLDELLPSPAEVRCVLAPDVELRLRALFDLMNQPMNSDLMGRFVSLTEDRFLRKLRAIVPAEDLQRATHQGQIDWGEVLASRPYLETMYIMETARAIDDIQRQFLESAKVQGAGA
ncbi:MULTISPECIES: hypothetical protein [Streptomyces]|uniref:hypothetical protein n=1 Tax=Streptomyces scabiei TaxID=1930 RepID=UPI0004E63696|nr:MULTISPECIES: hypothetical protein [Streptomyces]MBP5861950.1 hypothetical protein [Streptomyces sp. LBUM 1484]MBP5869104.1 hypothetical protein [Streptomyces sp. LBUM 1485]KFG10475.1 hypothetical protein IQ61_02585 [Streptomyces scabiei]MBP5877603.1 hypothetical protein [Streptomyces sp. LBUM 1477]MBP5885431.1 hypothetical protein [Streptomyces sp. LBUM 1487]